MVKIQNSSTFGKFVSQADFDAASVQLKAYLAEDWKATEWLRLIADIKVKPTHVLPAVRPITLAVNAAVTHWS